MTLGVLAPYRRLGIGSALLHHILDVCNKDDRVKQVYLHMQVNNEDAIKFYQTNGFTIATTIEKYYKNIEPADAHILQKALNT